MLVSASWHELAGKDFNVQCINRNDFRGPGGSDRRHTTNQAK